MARAGAALLALVLVAVGAAGCGEEEGVAKGGVVTAYVEAPLCGNAGGHVADGEAEDGKVVKVKFICLPAARGAELSQGVGGGRQIDLAVAGANARRATEDSRTVAYLEPADRAVSRFTHPILEAAGIGWISSSEGSAQAQLLRVLRESDSTDLRADVRDALGQ